MAVVAGHVGSGVHDHPVEGKLVEQVEAGQCEQVADVGGMVQQQASMVSFVLLFRLLGGIFLVLVPLILVMRRPRAGRGPAAAH